LSEIVEIPKIFKPLFEPSRYKVFHGGRGSGKSTAFAMALLIMARTKPMRILCAREFQASIKDSVKTLLDDCIERFKWGDFFTSTRESINGANGSYFTFSGIRSNPHKIKSMEGIDICWIEESNTASNDSLDLIIPTIRKPNSEIWLSFNPQQKTDPVYKRFIEETRPDAIVVKANYSENPFFPDVLKKELEWDKAHDFGKYQHVWEGEPVQRSEALVFKNWIIDESIKYPDNEPLYFGADFGFAVDPTTLIRCWVNLNERKIFIDHEAYGVGIEIDETPQLFNSVPEANRFKITADSARPETISYLKRNGFNVVPAKKGAGSVEEGIKFLQSYSIIVHPRCKRTIDELNTYSYKTDKITNEILPILLDTNNHCIDALRYALELFAFKSRPTATSSAGRRIY
jgi:phage terminase large subunit